MELKTKLIGGGVLALAFAGVAAVAGVYGYNRTFDYSSGTRNVYNIKISEKGSPCKTWEAEGTMLTPSDIGGQGNTSVFKFSVRDQETIKALQEAGTNSTQMYTLKYQQIKWRWANAVLTLSCPIDTEYMAKGLEAGSGDAYIHGGAFRNPQAPSAPVVAPQKRR